MISSAQKRAEWPTKGVHMTTFLTLLRRTAIALGAIAALTVTSEANAQAGTITLTNGSSCKYTSMTVNPTGAVDVQCDTGTPPPAGPGTFSVIGNVSNLSTGLANSGTAFQVRRVGGSAGAVNVSYSVSGVCVAVGAGTLSFADASALSQSVQVSTGGTTGDCTVTIVVDAPGLSGAASTLTKTIPVSAPVAGCPVNDTPVLTLPSSGSASPAKLLPSGGIASYRLPPTASNSGQFKLSETTVSFPVAPWYYEISISRCKGVIDEEQTGPGCYVQSQNVKLLTKIWMRAVSLRYPSQTAMDNANICFTPGATWQNGTTVVAGTQDYFINIRYTYALCSSGAQCGWVPQWVKYTY